MCFACSYFRQFLIAENNERNTFFEEDNNCASENCPVNNTIDE